MDENKALFSDIKFIIAQCYNIDLIRNILIEGGAKHINYLSEHVTLVVSDTHCSKAEEAVELFDKPVVTSLWVHLSIKANKLLPTEAFSPFKTIFQNVVASFSSSFSRTDIDTLASTLIYYGARVTKDIAASTHFVVPDSNSSDLSNRSSSNPNLKIVAPDWILESVKFKSRCDESLFDPELLLPPPPPPPTPPPPDPTPPAPSLVLPQQPPTREAETRETDRETSTNQLRPEMKSTENKFRFDKPQTAQNPPQPTLQRVRPQQVQPRPISQNHQQQFAQHAQSQMNHQAQKPLQTMPPSHLPRLQGVPQNIIRPVQPKFRPILPPNSNVPMANPIQQQQQQHHLRGVVPDSQQPKKVTMNFGPQYRKHGPHHNSIDPQQQTQAQQPPTYGPIQSQQQQQQPQSHRHMNIQQPPGPNIANSRLPQPTVYNQVRGTFQNSHIPPRGKPAQQQMVNSQQPTQMINRFQDPNAPMSQRPYQVCLQPQGVKSNYQPNNMPRPIYYTQQGNNQVQVRLPQQVPPVRHMQNEQFVYDNFSITQQPQEPISTHPHYQGHPPQQSFHNTHQQQQPQQFQPPPHQHHAHGQIQVRGPSQQQVQSQPSPMPHSQHQMQIQSQNMPQNTGQFQSNFPRSGPGPHYIRSPRAQFVNQQQQQQQLPPPSQKLDGPSHMNPEQMASQQSHRVPDNSQTQLQSVARPQLQPTMQSQVRLQSQPQPHPSIFDHIQESNLALIKAKVPIVTETLDYFGHDPKDVVPKDLPLSGCRFKFIEYGEINPKMKQQWYNGIRIAGGVLSDNIEGVTHLICETRSSDQFREATKLGIRSVTIYWINDVLAQNKLSYPWKALHFPIAFAKDNRPLTSQTISTTNFRGRERKELKEMILKSGALYTEYFSKSNTLLICGNVGGEKYEHALEWRIPIANCQILNDILLNNDRSLDAMLSQSKYQLFNQNDSLKLNSYSNIKSLMQPWKRPIPVAETTITLTLNANSADDSGIANSDPDTNGKPQTTDIVLADKDGSNEQLKSRKKSNEPVRLLFTHLESDLLNKLISFATKLGLTIASEPSNCTHLIVDSICRTPKFVCAFNYASYILSYKWIIESHEFGYLLDEKQFILRDSRGEETFSLNLVYSLLKRKKRRAPLFNNLVFFITPQVLAKVSSIKEMIESAGGVAAIKKAPSKLQITQLKAEGKRFVVVSCKEDLHLCSSLKAIGVDIVDAEFVVSGILRQDIDFESHRIRTITEAPFIRPETSPKAHISQSSPPKKLRLEDSSSIAESSN